MASIPKETKVSTEVNSVFTVYRVVNATSVGRDTDRIKILRRIPTILSGNILRESVVLRASILISVEGNGDAMWEIPSSTEIAAKLDRNVPVRIPLPKFIVLSFII